MSDPISTDLSTTSTTNPPPDKQDQFDDETANRLCRIIGILLMWINARKEKGIENANSFTVEEYQEIFAGRTKEQTQKLFQNLHVWGLLGEATKDNKKSYFFSSDWQKFIL